jgi:SAM-dependent methyltransferase
MSNISNPPTEKSIMFDVFQHNREIFDQRTVLDLACHAGVSAQLLQDCNAKHVYAVDIRSNLIEHAKNTVQGRVEFFCGDITDTDLILPLVQKSNVITIMGVFYHLFDHFRFMTQVFKPHIEHVIIETLAGSESLNPEMYWGFERTNLDMNGWCPGVDIIPAGTPNLSWILQSAKILGFECDWIKRYGRSYPKNRRQLTHEEYLSVAGPDWPPFESIIRDDPIPEFVEQEIANMLQVFVEKRMALRFYNTRHIQSQPIDLKTEFQWKDMTVMF